MNTYFHSVRLDEEKCMGCTNCIKRCPTQAIRVRSGKAHIISERCIDCGTCGAPTCRALAEDIVRGSATLHDCVFAMRDELAGTDMQEYIPAPFRSTGKKEETK